MLTENNSVWIFAFLPNSYKTIKFSSSKSYCLTQCQRNFYCGSHIEMSFFPLVAFCNSMLNGSHGICIMNSSRYNFEKIVNFTLLVYVYNYGSHLVANILYTYVAVLKFNAVPLWLVLWFAKSSRITHTVCQHLSMCNWVVKREVNPVHPPLCETWCCTWSFTSDGLGLIHNCR